MRNGHPLNSTRRRARKHQLATRDGQRCAYCHHPFATLREATLDHVVPVSLLRTWSAGALVLACRPCNQAKADRLPLSMALLIVWAYGSDVRDEPRHTPRRTDPTGPVFTADRSLFVADSIVFTDPGESGRPASIAFGPGEVDWLLLARLVHARVIGERSTPDQTEHRVPDRRAVRVGRLAHPRRTARLNTCEPATDRGVGA
ncbi:MULTISPECIES: HNH endonuclease [unclassified Streptomyces]|uniref:HNH endonuclease n=1 Tax=unclassified Streptomyces TaxID=2593676 RepID=UPI000823AAB8|nr:HNH endonuclease [Streptomyces sp. AmelKG-D3]MYT96718.1 HNH endonuclease [Streptomyces sp. SID8350]SCK58921.1 Restriction endonuclease [Streptomyces sp. AmelKG-D3]